MKLFFVFLLLWTALAVGGNYGLVYAHEKAHLQACKYFGGQGNYSIKFDFVTFGFSGVTQCSQSPKEELMLDSLNEGFGYGFTMLFNLLMVVFLLLALFITYRFWSLKASLGVKL